MAIVLDTHVHIYDCYDLDMFFGSAFANLAKHGNGSSKALLLAERNDCNFFDRLQKNGKAGKWKVSDGGSGEYFTVVNEIGNKLHVFAGRQVVTAERLEVLSLLSNRMIDDGLPARDVINASQDAGAVPVLTWALGKWMFERGKVVSRLVEESKPGELLIGDSFMRPAYCSEPSLMQDARKYGLGVIAGTDPLPFAGDETIVGRYASLIDAELDFADPAASLRKVLCSEKPDVRTVGSRGGIIKTAKRWMK
ncbi:hypothetical protein BVX94_02655 [bacterium B17]|nr:hypothetical protein BVX94_02655 [bacterium B17]